MKQPRVDYSLLLQLGRNTVRPAHFDRPPQPDAIRVENFTTEILALAIRADWAPIERLFRDHDAFGGEIDTVETVTQQRVDGPRTASGARELGIVDLLLWVTGRDGTTRELWVEVKAGSPITAKQVRVYRHAAAQAAVRHSREIVVLAGGWEPRPDGIDPEPCVHTWAQLADVVEPNDPAEWHALTAFLRHRGLIGKPSPVLPDERLAEVLDTALEAAADVDVSRMAGGTTAWRRRNSIRSELARRAREGSGQVIRLWSPGGVRLDLGLSTRAHGRALIVELGFAWDMPVVHEALRELVRASWPGDPWSPVDARADNGVIYASVRWPPYGQEDVAAWVVERVHELRGAGLLVDLDRDGRVIDARSPFRRTGELAAAAVARSGA
jgi:hypothetical protein